MVNRIVDFRQDTAVQRCLSGGNGRYRLLGPKATPDSTRLSGARSNSATALMMLFRIGWIERGEKGGLKLKFTTSDRAATVLDW
jgi:hypothetical protein